MTQDQVLTMIAGPIAIAGFALPWFGHAHRGVLFGVSVPASFEQAPEAHRSIARYRRDAILWVLLLLAVVYLCVRFAGDAVWLMLALSAVSLPLELLGCFYLWHREHVSIARLRGRAADLDAQDALAAPIRGDDGLPAPDRPVGLLLLAGAAFVPLLVAALYLESHFDAIPATFPQHWNALGQVNGWGERSPATVFLPPLMGGAAVLIVVAIAVLIGLAVGPEARHRMRSLAPLVTLAWLLSCIFAGASMLPFWASLALNHLGAVIVVMIFLSVGIVLWLLARTAPAMPGARTLHPSDSSHWRAGFIYVNAENPSLLVPKRFGWGWTLNFARPAAWLFLLFLLILATTMLWLPRLLHRA